MRRTSNRLPRIHALLGRAVSLALLGGILAACGDDDAATESMVSSAPPTVFRLILSPAAIPFVEASGNFVTRVEISGTLDFADSDADVTTLALEVADSAGRTVAATKQPATGALGQVAGTQPASIVVDDVAEGVYTVRARLLDAKGATSNTVSAQYRIVPTSDRPTLFADTGPNPRSLLLANDRLFWAESGDVALRSVGVGGEPAQVLAQRMVNPLAVATVGSDVVWMEDRPLEAAGCGVTPRLRTLYRTSADGITRRLAGDYNCRDAASADIAVVGGLVYWVSSGGVGSSTYVINATSVVDGATSKVRMTTSREPIVAFRVAADGTVFWLQKPSPPAKASIMLLFSGASFPTTLASELQMRASTFAVDGVTLYYTTGDAQAEGAQTLLARRMLSSDPPRALATTMVPIRLEVTGGQVVWIEPGRVNAIAASGGPVRLLASPTDTPIDLLVSEGNVLWSEASGAVHGQTGSVRSVPLAGGDPVTLMRGGNAPHRLAIDSGSVLHWTEGGPVGVAEGFARIARLAPSGSAQTLVAGISSAAPSLAAGDAHLYVADKACLKRVPLGGGLPQTLTCDDAEVGGLVAAQGWLYWNNAKSAVRRLPLDGGSVETLVPAWREFAVAAGPLRRAGNGDLYWVSGDHPIMLSMSSGSTTSFEASLLDIALDDESLFYVRRSNGDLVKLPLPDRSFQSQVMAPTFTMAPIVPLLRYGSELYWFDAKALWRLPAAGGQAAPLLYVRPGVGAPDAFGVPSFAVDMSRVFIAYPSGLGIWSVRNE